MESCWTTSTTNSEPADPVYIVLDKYPPKKSYVALKGKIKTNLMKTNGLGSVGDFWIGLSSIIERTLIFSVKSLYESLFYARFEHRLIYVYDGKLSVFGKTKKKKNVNTLGPSIVVLNKRNFSHKKKNAHFIEKRVKCLLSKIVTNDFRDSIFVHETDRVHHLNRIYRNPVRIFFLFFFYFGNWTIINHLIITRFLLL